MLRHKAKILALCAERKANCAPVCSITGACVPASSLSADVPWPLTLPVRVRLPYQVKACDCIVLLCHSVPQRDVCLGKGAFYVCSCMLLAASRGRLPALLPLTACRAAVYLKRGGNNEICGRFSCWGSSQSTQLLKRASLLGSRPACACCAVTNQPKEMALIFQGQGLGFGLGMMLAAGWTDMVHGTTCLFCTRQMARVLACILAWYMCNTDNTAVVMCTVRTVCLKC